MKVNKIKQEHEQVLLEIINHIIEGTLSSRKAAEYISYHTGIKVSHEGLRKMARNHQKKLDKDGREDTE